MIRHEDFIDPNPSYPWRAEVDAEREALDALVDVFASEMKVELHDRVRQGYRGWDDLANRIHVWNRLLEHIRRIERGEKGQLVGLANLAAMLWNMERE